MNVGRLALLLYGASLYWPLLRRNGLFYSLAGHDFSGMESLGWYALFLLCVVGTVVMSCAFETRARELFQKRKAAVCALFGIQAILKVVGVFLLPSGWVYLVVSAADIATYAIVFVCLTFAWADWYVHMPRSTSAVLASGTFILSFVVIDAVILLPLAVYTVTMAVLPLVSIIIWYNLHEEELPRLSSSTMSDVSGAFSHGMVVLLAVFLVAGGVIRGAMTQIVSGQPPGVNLVMDVMTMLYAALQLVFCLLYKSGRRFLLTVWSGAAIIFFAGLLVTLAIGGDYLAAGRQTVVVARTCLDLIYWIVLIDLVSGPDVSFIRTFGFGFILVDVISSFLGYVALPVAVAASGVGIEAAAVPLAGVITFILIIASIFFFNYTASAQASLAIGPEMDAGPATSPKSADLMEERIEQMDTRLSSYGLTERELEVAELLTDGNSQKKVSEILGVSIGTVQSHIKSVYRKLGIHSRQELIDMMVP